MGLTELAHGSAATDDSGANMILHAVRCLDAGKDFRNAR